MREITKNGFTFRAVQFTGDNHDDITNLVGNDYAVNSEGQGVIKTGAGDTLLQLRSWVLLSSDGQIAVQDEAMFGALFGAPSNPPAVEDAEPATPAPVDTPISEPTLADDELIRQAMNPEPTEPQEAPDGS